MKQLPDLGGAQVPGLQLLLGSVEHLFPAFLVFHSDPTSRGHEERDTWRLPVRQQGTQILAAEKLHWTPSRKFTFRETASVSSQTDSIQRPRWSVPRRCAPVV